MIVDRMTLGIMCTNTYLAYQKDTGECLVIDPADHEDRIAGRIQQLQLQPCAILLTHGHFDHIGAAEALRTHYDIPIYAMEQEAQILTTDGNLASLIRKKMCVQADVYLRDSQKIQLVGNEIQVIHTPGHTIGSCCYYIEQEKILFSGDTLFQNSYGRTDFPTGSTSSILRSIQEKLLILPGDTIVYPGHNDETTIELERQNYDIYQI